MIWLKLGPLGSMAPQYPCPLPARQSDAVSRPSTTPKWTKTCKSSSTIPGFGSTTRRRGGGPLTKPCDRGSRRPTTSWVRTTSRFSASTSTIRSSSSPASPSSRSSPGYWHSRPGRRPPLGRCTRGSCRRSTGCSWARATSSYSSACSWWRRRLAAFAWAARMPGRTILDMSWFAMLFAAGVGIGLMFFGVSEPVEHFLQPPLGLEAAGPAAARLGMASAIYHWGIHGWAIYAVAALSIAFASYNLGLPMTLRSAFYPLLGEAVWGRYRPRHRHSRRLRHALRAGHVARPGRSTVGGGAGPRSGARRRPTPPRSC